MSNPLLTIHIPLSEVHGAPLNVWPTMLIIGILGVILFCSFSILARAIDPREQSKSKWSVIGAISVIVFSLGSAAYFLTADLNLPPGRGEVFAEQVERIENHYGVVFTEGIRSFPSDEYGTRDVVFYAEGDYTTQYSGVLINTGEEEFSLLVDVDETSASRIPWGDVTLSD